ncbi:phosphoadenylyl-sulfate reductase [Francisellaceae bacterium]|nr:phosphoadenylyl-sulfate reductase [Francisellaceae bacterium]
MKIDQKTNALLANLSPEERINWVIQHISPKIVLSSSFGAQSAVMLHMATKIKKDIPVILIDTGYLFKETYQFIDDLTKRLGLNLKVFRNHISPAWQEARYGKLWQKGLDGIHQYNELNKVVPMQNALNELESEVWMVGLRRSQSEERSKMQFLSNQDNRYKLLPILDWSNKDIHVYLKKHNLPYHPLWEKGYVSIGDTHTTKPLSEDISENETRFFGLTRECGLHVNPLHGSAEQLNNSIYNNS